MTDLQQKIDIKSNIISSSKHINKLTTKISSINTNINNVIEEINSVEETINSETGIINTGTINTKQGTIDNIDSTADDNRIVNKKYVDDLFVEQGNFNPKVRNDFTESERSITTHGTIEIGVDNNFENPKTLLNPDGSIITKSINIDGTTLSSNDNNELTVNNKLNVDNTITCNRIESINGKITEINVEDGDYAIVNKKYVDEHGGGIDKHAELDLLHQDWSLSTQGGILIGVDDNIENEKAYISKDGELNITNGYVINIDETSANKNYAIINKGYVDDKDSIITNRLDTDETNISNNTTNISTNTTEITNIKSRLDTDETNISNNTNNISSNSTEITNIKSRLDTDETNISNNTTNISSNTTEITNIKSRLDTDETNISSNLTEITNIKSRLDTDETNISSNTTEITNIKSRLDTDETNISTNSTNISSNTTEITNIKSRLDTDETNISTNTTNISNNTTNISSNTTEITNIKSRLDTDETNISNNTTEISNINAQLSVIGQSYYVEQITTGDISTKTTDIIFYKSGTEQEPIYSLMEWQTDIEPQQYKVKNVPNNTTCIVKDDATYIKTQNIGDVQTWVKNIFKTNDTLYLTNTTKSLVASGNVLIGNENTPTVSIIEQTGNIETTGNLQLKQGNIYIGNNINDPNILIDSEGNITSKGDISSLSSINVGSTITNDYITISVDNQNHTNITSTNQNGININSDLNINGGNNLKLNNQSNNNLLEINCDNTNKSVIHSSDDIKISRDSSCDIELKNNKIELNGNLQLNNSLLINSKEISDIQLGSETSNDNKIIVSKKYLSESLNNIQITSVSLTTGTISTTPSNNTDISNKKYVDDSISGITSVSLTTGTISTTPSSNTDISNKKYVDDSISGITDVSLTTGTISTTPSNNTDIVNKQYVDDNNVGKKYYDNNVLKGEVFNSYTGTNANTASGNYSHAEGYNTDALGNYSHAEGSSTTASGHQSHAECHSTTASGNYSHAEGSSTTASGNYSHAEGGNTTASGYWSHAEGSNTEASGDCSHAEGYDTEASGDCSHASGGSTIAYNDNMFVLGQYNVSGNKTDNDGKLFVIGNGTDFNARSDAFVVKDDGSAYIQTSLSINNQEITGTTKNSSDTDDKIITTKKYVDNNNVGQKYYVNNVSKGEVFNRYTGGFANIASGEASHAEGINTTASGYYSHSEGYYTTASGHNSHAEGYYTEASGDASHASGEYTTAYNDNMTVIGQYNVSGNKTDNDGKLFVIGNGSNTTRSDAFVIKNDGDTHIIGNDDKGCLILNNTKTSDSTSYTTKSTVSYLQNTDPYVIGGLNQYIPPNYDCITFNTSLNYMSFVCSKNNTLVNYEDTNAGAGIKICGPSELHGTPSSMHDVFNSQIRVKGDLRMDTGNIITHNGTIINNTIFHNAPITNNISEYNLGDPVFLSDDNKIYYLDKVDNSQDIYTYKEITNNFLDKSIDQIHKVQNIIPSNNPYNKFIGVVIKINHKENIYKTSINGIVIETKLNIDTIDFATHGDFIFKVNDNTIEHQTTSGNMKVYEIGDEILYDGRIIDYDQPISRKLENSIVGKITYIPSDNINYLSVFKK